MRAPRSILLAVLVAAGLAGVGLSGCSKANDPWQGKGGPPRVVVTFPPLYCFAKNVAGDGAGIVCLLHNTGPHDYQYNVEDTLYLRGADLFLANGLGLDGFAPRMKEAVNRPGLAYVELASEKTIPKDELREGECHHGEHGHHGHQDEGEHHHDLDPHVWLGVPRSDEAGEKSAAGHAGHAHHERGPVFYMVNKIRDSLKEKDRARTAAYDRRAEEYLAKLRKLHADGTALLAGKKNRRIVTFHESLAYFADSFDLTIEGTVQAQPGQEPDAKSLSKLIERCVKRKVAVIAVEPQYSKATAQMLQDEIEKKGKFRPKLVVIDPLETAVPEELDAGWYERKMRANLQSLADNLE